VTVFSAHRRFYSRCSWINFAELLSCGCPIVGYCLPAEASLLFSAAPDVLEISLSFTVCAWGRRITIGSSPNRSSLRDYRLIRRYFLPPVQEYLYSPKRSWFCVFFKVNVSLWLMYWKISVWVLNCWFLQTTSFLFLVILRNCSAPCYFYTLWLLGHFCSSNFSKFYFHVTNLTFNKFTFLLANRKFRSRSHFKITVRYSWN